MGSRPDGWWRDRAGAAARLVVALAPLVGCTVALGPAGSGAGEDGGGRRVRVGRVVAVLEGKSCAARVPDDVAAVVDVVRAPASGDDTIVAQAGRCAAAGGVPLVVTADRGLRARLPDGCLVSGPRTLLDLL